MINENLNEKIIKVFTESLYNDKEMWIDTLLLNKNSTYALFIDAVLSDDYNKFLDLNWFHLKYTLPTSQINYILKEKTNWLVDRNFAKKWIKKHVLAHNMFTLEVDFWMNWMKEEKYNFLAEISTPIESYDFKSVLENTEYIDILFEKLEFWSRLFKNVDVTKLPEKYFKDIKYTSTIIRNAHSENIRAVLKMLPKEFIFSDEVWAEHKYTLISAYKADVVKYASVKQLLDESIIHIIVRKVPQFFIEQYDAIINNKKLLKSLLFNNVSFAINNIKDEDFYKLKKILLHYMNWVDKEFIY